MTAGANKISHRFHRCHRFILREVKMLMLIIKFKFQISNFKVKVMTMFKVNTIDFRALTAITLFMLALLFSLPNLVIAIMLMILISALLEIIKMLAEWQPKKMTEWLPKKQVRRIS